MTPDVLSTLQALLLDFLVWVLKLAQMRLQEPKFASSATRDLALDLLSGQAGPSLRLRCGVLRLCANAVMPCNCQQLSVLLAWGFDFQPVP